MLLEVCVDSLASARAAIAGGADRLELCSALLAGGLTPYTELLRQIRHESDVAVRCLIRPRAGDFLYMPEEIEMMCAQITELRSAGANGFVIGCLNPDGTLDCTATARLAKAANSAGLTLHRAIDVSADPLQTYRDAAARMIFWDAEDEQEVVRRPHGISISEQIQVINSAVKRGADALVCECMAVRPDYQRVYQHQIINAGLTVITNVLEDHLDEMGPTTDQIAWAFADTIPYNGAVVIPDCEYTEYFKSVAEERGTRVFVADDSLISEEYLKQFDYRLFPHNCSVALAAADALGIDRETALSAMLKAHADPGALRFYDISLPKGDCCIVNAFAANEPSSSLDIWNIVCSERPEQSANPIILMNCRPDRVDRTKQFVRDFFPKIPNAVIIAAGESTGNITKAEAHGRFPNADRYINLEKQSPEKVLETLKPLLPGRIVMCVGNIHGSGEPILHALLEYGRLPLPEPIFRDRRKSRH